MNDKKTIILYSIIGIIVILSTVVTSVLLKNTNSTPSEKEIKTPTTIEVQGNVTFTFINSGEGMSSIIETSKGNIIVIDTGTGNNSLLQDYLSGRTINYLLFTGLTNSQIGGLDSLLQSCTVEKVIFPYKKESNAENDLVNIFTGISIPVTDSDLFSIDDLQVAKVFENGCKISYLVIHGTDQILFQGTETIEETQEMLINNTFKTKITGIVASANGNNEFFSEALFEKKPTFILANIVENNTSNNKLIEFVKENDIDLYSFVANPMLPLHFSSSGKNMRLIGYE